jgi:uncharacterized protein YggU (UPF0235/DUF167 family)
MYIKVKVTAGANKKSFTELEKDSFRATVREPAERNLANARVRELVAEHFGVPTAKVRIVSGHHSQSKIFSVLD